MRNVLFNDMSVRRNAEEDFIQLIEKNNDLRQAANLPLIEITDGPYANKTPKTVN